MRSANATSFPFLLLGFLPLASLPQSAQGQDVPSCAPGDVAIRDSNLAGASNLHRIYVIEYRGAAACRLRGHPKIAVYDKSGKLLPSYAQYSDEPAFSSAATGEANVIVSAANRSAWFALRTGTACAPPPTPPLRVKIALPQSRLWLRTILFAHSNCAVSVSPIRPMAALGYQ